MKSSTCNVCGGKDFGLGPGGRASRNGNYPRCLSCNSLERHRIFRSIMETLRQFNDFENMDVLQFSSDRSVEPEWFLSFERSIYGGSNSLDIQKVDRENRSYDFIICNHVLEHVRYDNSALNEIFRLLRPNGLCFLSVPNPANQAVTEDWGYPNKDQHDHYRVYGADIVERFARYIEDAWIIAVDGTDAITNSSDRVYFICRSAKAGEGIRAAYPDAALIQAGYN